MSPILQTRQTNRTLSPYVRFAGILLLTLAILISALWTSGCDDCDGDNVEQGESTTIVEPLTQEPIYRKRLELSASFGDSESNPFQFYGRAPGPPFPNTLKITWHPDLENCKDFEFYNDPKPEPGGPPFVFNLPVDPDTGATPIVSVHFKNPSGLSSQSWTLESGDQKESFSRNYRPLGWRDDKELTVPLASTTKSKDPEPLDDDYYFWEIMQEYTWVDGPAMTTNLCQRGLDFLQSGKTFAAVRFLVQPPTLVYSDPYTLPVAFRGEYSPTVQLLDYNAGAASLVTAPLEYKFDTLGFMETELPEAVGEHWMALGMPSDPPITCPPGIDTDNWRVKIELALDFGGGENTCADCVLPVYYCYEGEQQPMLDSLVRRFLDQEYALGTSLESYQGSGITCLGPDPLWLKGSGPPVPPFGFSEEHTAYISNTQTISFTHSVYRMRKEPVTVTLDYTSSLDLPWGIYSGTWEAPDIPLVPISEEVSLGESSRSRVFWMITDLPAEAKGPEILQITATSVTTPSLQAITADLLWIGDWVAPPQKEEHKIYLPLVLK